MQDISIEVLHTHTLCYLINEKEYKYIINKLGD